MFFGAILRPRRGGKSTLLIDIARKNPKALFVVSTEHQKNYIDLPRKQVATLDELLNGRHMGLNEGPILFDNFEYMLESLLRGRVHRDTDIIISATGTNL